MEKLHKSIDFTYSYSVIMPLQLFYDFCFLSTFSFLLSIYTFLIIHFLLLFFFFVPLTYIAHLSIFCLLSFIQELIKGSNVIRTPSIFKSTIGPFCSNQYDHPNIIWHVFWVVHSFRGFPHPHHHLSFYSQWSYIG